MKRLIFPVLLSSLALPVAFAQNNLQPVLARLDQAAAGFHNAQADVRYDNYTKVVRDHDIQTGSLFIERTGKATSMGAVFFDASNKSMPARVVDYDGKQLAVFTPGTNQEDIFSAGGNQARYESFLTLGFGGSGRDLAAAWNITDQGAETINGIKAEKLDLVSKDPSVVNTFSHITIWLDLSRGVSVRQIFYQPNGNMRTADYTNIRENAKIDRKPYQIKKGAQIIRH